MRCAERRANRDQFEADCGVMMKMDHIRDLGTTTALVVMAVREDQDLQEARSVKRIRRRLRLRVGDGRRPATIGCFGELVDLFRHNFALVETTFRSHSVLSIATLGNQIWLTAKRYDPRVTI